jgi:hypothetical protein
MAKFIKTVEATQFFYDGPAVPGVIYPPTSRDGKTYIGDAYVKTSRGERLYLQNGDWVVAEPDGAHYYRISPVVFAATYQAVA